MPQAPAKPIPPPELREGDIATLSAAALAAILKDPATSEFQKAKACVRLGELGAKEAIPLLVSLLADPHLSVYARNGLEPMPGPEASDALRAALPTASGLRQIGIVNSIAKRRDSKALPALAKMIYSPDADLARAAAAAVGSIGGEPARKELAAALHKTSGPTKIAVADASLLCAERLLAAGQRAEALAFYGALSAPDIPKPMRLAAMNAIIREETSPTRPR